jgi:integrase
MASLHKDPKRNSPYWYCAYTLADGRRAFRSTKKTKKNEAWIVCQGFVEMEAKVAGGGASAEQLLKVLNGTLARLGQEPVERPSAKLWFARWLKTEQGAVSDSTLERYRQVTDDFLAFLGAKANCKLAAITTDDITAFRDKLLAEGRTPQTVNFTVRRILKRPFTVALAEGNIDRNPVGAVRQIRGVSAQKGVFTPAQVVRLVTAATGDWPGLILAGYCTGARLLDLARLKWSNVDLALKTITFTQRKTDAKVVLPLHPELQEYLLSRASSDSLHAPVFPELYHKSGGGENGLSGRFKRIMQQAGIEGGLIRERKGVVGRSLSALSFHSLRHSFTSALANAGVPAEIRQKLTGHLDAKSHAIYTHHELETIRCAVQSLPRLPKQ